MASDMNLLNFNLNLHDFNSFLNLYLLHLSNDVLLVFSVVTGIAPLWSQTVLISVLGILQFGPTLVFLDASCDETQPRGPF